MCGIAGILYKDRQKTALPVLQAMAATLRHRGPDGEGFWIEPRSGQVGLCHRRLSVIDLATGGQPMSTPDGLAHITFNGEIYNYKELRARLQRRGCTVQTHSDTEVILHGFQARGAAFLQELRGMFAFALWDSAENRLLLARDRLGKKPLYYYENDQVFVFASEPKAVFASGLVQPTVNPHAINSYLMYQYVPSSQCAFKELQKLAPGEYLTLDLEPRAQSKTQVYWQLKAEVDSDVSEAEWTRQVRETVLESVKLRMISDVPLGAFLSGGVDSSIVVAAMSQMTQEPVKTFSIGFKERLFDETHFARQLAGRFNTHHHETVVEPNAAGILSQLVHHFDEPFGDPSAIPTWYLSEMTRREVTVALSGDGGDELFGGYDRYVAVRWAGKTGFIPRGLRKALFGAIAAMIPASTEIKSRRFRAKRFLHALGLPPAESYLQWIAIADKQRRAWLFTDDFSSQTASENPEQWFTRWMELAQTNDLVTQASYSDSRQYLPDDLLVKADICSMAHSLEVRNPLIDHVLTELAFAIPSRFKINGRNKKHILKLAFADMLPLEIAMRPKMGFGVPVNDWFRGQLRETAFDTLLSAQSKNRGVFNSAALEQLLNDHIDGRGNHGHLLWMLVVLESWFRQKIEAVT